MRTDERIVGKIAGKICLVESVVYMFGCFSGNNIDIISVCVSDVGFIRCFLCLFAVSDMTVFMTHLEKNRPGFSIEMKRQGVLFETFRRLRANVQAFYLKCQGVFREKKDFSERGFLHSPLSQALWKGFCFYLY